MEDETRRMTLVEALKQSIYVRRKVWPWDWYWYYDPKLEQSNPSGEPHVWKGRSNNPSWNHLDNEVSFADAIAEDWEPLEDTP